MALDISTIKTLPIDEVFPYFRNYFHQHYKVIMEKGALCVPNADDTSLEKPRKKILKTLRDWCNTTNRKNELKGFVFDEYDLNAHLKFLKYPSKFFQSNDGKSSDVTIAYNPIKKLVLILRRAKNKNLKQEMVMSTMDMMKLTLLYKDVLVKSGVTLMNLLVVEENPNNYPWNCKNCNYHVIAIESLASWLKHDTCVHINNEDRNFDQNFSFDFSAKLIGFLASFQFQKGEDFYGNEFVTLASDVIQQISQTILMTPEQTNIVYSPKKHIIIKGCYGSGKTIVAHKRAERISGLLGKEDSLYYIICDSRSMLKVDTQFSSKINVFHNVRQRPESAIIKEILNNDSKKGNLNLIFEEFDGENLTKSEATKLNTEFKTNERLKDSNIMIICQPLEITRLVGNVKKQGNMFHLLETMFTPCELTINMRTTKDINSIVASTVKALRQHEPVYYSSQNKKASVNVDSDSKTKTGNDRFQNKEEKTFNIACNDTENTFNRISQNKINVDLEYEASKDQIKIQTEKNFFKMEKNTEEGDSLDYKTLKPDEVYDFLPTIKEPNAIKITSTFQHMETKQCGHNIHSELPSLFEIDYPEKSLQYKLQLMIALGQIIGRTRITKENKQLCVKTFTDLNDIIDIKKHVILHFDPQNDIPKILHVVLKLMQLSDKITNRYEEFKDITSEKKIFICNYRKFRGLEYPRVIAILDPAFHHLLHFLPECFNRCTTFLHIIIIKMLDTAGSDKLFKEMVEGWKKQPPLVNERKIYIKNDHFVNCLPSEAEKLAHFTVRIKPDVLIIVEKEIENVLNDWPENFDITSRDWNTLKIAENR